MKKKPSWFRPIDFMTMAFAGIVVAGLTIYMLVVGYDGPKSAPYLMATVALGFFAVWGRFCQARKQSLDEFTWYPTYGFMVKPEYYLLPSPVAFDALVKAAIDAWSPYFSNAEQIVQSEVLWVWFKKDLNENDKNLAHYKVKGLTIDNSFMMEVDYDTSGDDLAKTAFRHELGHVIMGHATGKWDQTVHHAFMREHGLL
jgi:hypothetical protein